MSWKLPDIKAAYDRGQEQGATHMIVAYDSFDHSNYPIYVVAGQSPLDCFPSNGDRVDEVYRYALGWEAQSAEYRAYHLEMN